MKTHICRSHFYPLLAFLSASTLLRAELRMPPLFSDHMVVQRDAPLPVWGWADPGEEVTVEFAGQSVKTKADEQGKWRLRLDKVQLTQSATMKIKASNTVVINDVLAGEVWLASGQSNMQMTVGNSSDANAEIAAANHPQIRMFTVGRRVAHQPQDDCGGKWIICSPQSVGGFSATAYYFGRDLHQKLKSPVGLIHASWGGTAIEGWTSLPAQKSQPALNPIFKNWEKKLNTPFDSKAADERYAKQVTAWKKQVAKTKATGGKAPRAPQKALAPAMQPSRPANLFNAMIAPLIPYAIRGAIWYQGENSANGPFPHLYQKQLPLLIEDWRKRWNQGDFPFGWVQLPNYKERVDDPNAPSSWALVREAMLKSLAVPQTGMAICIDVGDASNIHPKNKQTVGKRLAAWAMADVYGMEGPSSGPIVSRHEIKGSEIMVAFKHSNGGLKSNGSTLKGFVIAGADRKWVRAQARIVDGDKVMISSPEVAKPVAARYAWADNPDCNLTNGAGLPASPFRTDDW